jgi:manganese/zinc/iron transport system permease protein
MIDQLVDFFSFSHPNIRTVTLGTVVLSMVSAVVGCFTYLRKRALVGDAVSHAILPGVALAFFIGQGKHPAFLLIGALLAGWIALLTIDGLVNNSKLKTDTAIAFVLSVFFGFGIFLLSIIQQKGTGEQAGLDSFLFGKAAGMTNLEVQTFLGVAALLVLLIVVFFHSFKLVAFNRDFAISLGAPVKLLEFLLATMTVLAITTGIQSVGVVLMAALLITPAAAARPFTNRLLPMLLLSALFGGFGGLIGSFVSYTQPQMPTGPWIVVVISFFAVMALLFAPHRGVLANFRRQWKNQQIIRKENLLKAFYQLKERASMATVGQKDLLSIRAFSEKDLHLGLRQLQRDGSLEKDGEQFKLTAKGRARARRVVRLHRLWEVYLTQRMRMAPDQIHPQAETMEHLITPELEAQLIRELQEPEKDPHNRIIPYDS